MEGRLSLYSEVFSIQPSPHLPMTYFSLSKLHFLLSPTSSVLALIISSAQIRKKLPSVSLRENRNSLHKFHLSHLFEYDCTHG